MRIVPAALLCAALSACASPDPKLYTLVANNPAAPVAASLGPPPVLEVRRVAIPTYLDRPEIVRSAADYRVKLAKNERWSEPLGDVLQGVLTDDLRRRVPGGMVFSSTGSISMKSTLIVEVDVSRLESDGAGQVVLAAQFSVHGPDGAGPAQAVYLTAPFGSGSTADYAAALSGLVSQLADRIAAAPRPTPPIQPVADPA